MQESYNKFQMLAMMVRNACHPVSTPLEKCLTKMRDMMDLTFQEFYHDFKLFRMEVNSPHFEKDEGDTMLEYNDSWLEKITDDYFNVIECSDDKLESLASRNIPALSKIQITTQEQLEAEVAAEDQLKLEMKAIDDSAATLPMLNVGVDQSKASGDSLLVRLENVEPLNLTDDSLAFSGFDRKLAANESTENLGPEKSHLGSLQSIVPDSIRKMKIDQKGEENDKYEKKKPISEQKVEEVFHLPSAILVAKHPGPQLSDLVTGTLSGPNFLCSWRDRVVQKYLLLEIYFLQIIFPFYYVY